MSGSTQQQANNQFYPFACQVAAVVRTPPSYATQSYLATGFEIGILQPIDLNTVLRQSSFVSSTFAQWVADQSGQNVVDSGIVATFEGQITSAVTAAATKGANPLWQYYLTGPNSGFTITMPAWANHIVIGAVGGGGGGSNCSSTCSSGGGGGAGGWIEALFAIPAGTSLGAIIGAGGAAQGSGGGTFIYNGSTAILTALGGSASYIQGVNLSVGAPGGAIGSVGGLVFNAIPGAYGDDGMLDQYTTKNGRGGTGPFGGNGRAGSASGLFGAGPGCGGSGSYLSLNSTLNAGLTGTGAAGNPGILRWAFLA